MCNFIGCNIRPNYNYKGEKKGIFCNSHKLDGMIDVINKICPYKDCKIRSNYNFEGQKPLFCSFHKEVGMINLVTKRCSYNGCYTLPNYNFEKETKAIYCSRHKLDGMIDVKNKSCKYEGCKILAIYNFKGLKVLFCNTHKLDGMIDVKNKICKYEGCRIQPTYNYQKETIAIYCNTHKLEGMIDIKHKKCKTYLCSTRVQEKYNGYCLFCFIHLFPDKPISRNYKTKEYSVVAFVKTNFVNMDWISDKTIKDGCSKKRPDILLDLGYQIIIIEIDENQHKSYNTICENARINQLSLDLDCRPIVYIRFNPDDYKNKNENITSCWGINKHGICVIKKNKQTEWNERLKVLENNIKYWINPENKVENKLIEVVELFYDIT